MEGQHIKGLMEAYSHIYSEPELLEEEVEVEEVDMELEEDSEVLDEQGRNRTPQATIDANRRALANRLLYGNPEGRRNRVTTPRQRRGSGARNRSSSSSSRPVANLPADYKKTELAAGAAAEKSRPGAGLPVSGGGNQGSNRPAPRPSSAPASKPAAAAPAKDRMASASKEDRMAAWAKANPKLAAAKAERDRTRGTSSTTNPLMKDMKSRLPAAAPKKTGGEAAAASTRNTSGPKFNANAPKLNVASRPSGAATAGAAKAAASKTAPKFNPSAPKIDLKSKTAPAKAAGTKFNPNAPKILNQDVDIFDIIKGHLLDEGFAETEEAAMVIMANMSEEWRQDIIEFFGPKTVTPKDSPSGTKSVQVGKKYPAQLNGRMVNVQYDKSGNKSTKPMTGMERGIQALKMRNTGHSSMSPRP